MSISAKRLKEIGAIESFWQRVELQLPQPKKGIYIRLDTDVIDWLKSKGKGYQTRMNAMLRELMRSEKEQRGRRGRP